MTEEKLLAAGIDYESGVKRFAGKAALYEKYLLKLPEDPNYGELILALEQKDYQLAFRCAHTLKGVAGNLSINRLYECIVPLVEALRSGALSQVDELVSPVGESYRLAVNAIRS